MGRKGKERNCRGLRSEKRGRVVKKGEKEHNVKKGKKRGKGEK